MSDLHKHPDKSGYDEVYGERAVPWYAKAVSREEYIERFGLQSLTPFCDGGWDLSGYGRGMAVRLAGRLGRRANSRNELTVLEAGCGDGGLSVFLACMGYNVIGVDVSMVGCNRAAALAKKYSLENCRILNEPLGKLSIDDSSVDIILGLGTLHHFIKDPAVPAEFSRILKENGVGVFWDPYGENIFYRLFHDRKKMQRLGDTSITKRMIESYFKSFHVNLFPIRWFSMTDKLFIRLLGWRIKNHVRKISKVTHSIDFKLPLSSRVALWLSGQVITIIRNV